MTRYNSAYLFVLLALCGLWLLLDVLPIADVVAVVLVVVLVVVVVAIVVVAGP